jgi:SAM-dependent methyltransferase
VGSSRSELATPSPTPGASRLTERSRRSPTISDIVGWDVRNWATALPFWSARTSLRLDRANALEVGARTGGLSLWLAARGSKVTCTDVTAPGVDVQQRHADFGLRDRIDYSAVDVLHMPYKAAFDIVCFKSVLGAIGCGDRKDLQAAAVAQMYEALRSGGELWFAENLAASRLHQFARRRFVAWGGSWRYLTISELAGLLSPFDELVYSTTGFLAAFGRSEAQRSVLGALDQAIVSGLVPKSWHYIADGIARKR